jgi:hypothetical protein
VYLDDTDLASLQREEAPEGGRPAMAAGRPPAFSFYAFREAGLGDSTPFALPKAGMDGADATVCALTQSVLAKGKFVGEVRAARRANRPHSRARACDQAREAVYFDPLKEVSTEAKIYRSGFAWGQLSGWFKQTVNDPSSSLSAERRGTLSLPDIESTCTSNGNKNYMKVRLRIRARTDAGRPAAGPPGDDQEDPREARKHVARRVALQLQEQGQGVRQPLVRRLAR